MKRVREMIRQQPKNHWAVYQACKILADVLFPLSHQERVALLKKELPGADYWAIAQGLAEFESVPVHNWATTGGIRAVK